jgi:hypothetical protein
MEKRVLRMLQNLDVLPELGRQRCFELGNPFYYQDDADSQEPGNEQGNLYRKELPTGEIYLVSIRVSADGNQSYVITDTPIRRIR